MKCIRCDLPFAEQIEIHPMADLHIGDSMCDFKGIVNAREVVNRGR